MRCAVYVRVSTDMDTQKSSIAHQKNFFEKYIEDKGWHLYKIYEDIESGMSVDKRTGLMQLIKDSRDNLFDIVLTKSISRFARNTLEGLQYIRELKGKNIRFITIEDAFDSEEYDEFMFTLLLSLAQKESEKISERIRFGKYERAQKGFYNGSNPPYGYKKEKNSLIPAEDISTEVVKLIFNMYLQGHGLYRIAKELNEKKYPTPSQVLNKTNSSSLWHQSTVRNILTNEVYIGNLVQNKSRTKDILTGRRETNPIEKFIEVEDTHSGIISNKIFSEVQRIMKDRVIRRTGNNKHLFTNILYCGECGSAMHYKKDRESYICGKQNKMGKEYCKGAYIKEAFLKELLKRDLSKTIRNLVDLQGINAQLNTIRRTKNMEELKSISSEIGIIKKKKDRLLNLYIEDLIDKVNYEEKKISLENQIEFLQSRKNRLELKMEKASLKFDDMDSLIEYIDLNNRTLEKLIKKIEVSNKGIVKLYYKFSSKAQK